MIELYHGGPTGHSASALIALAEKGLDFTSHPIDLAGGENHSEAFLELNPEGQVPVLLADGRTLTGTFHILLYLDEAFPEPSLGGEGTQARYAVHKWGKYVETHIAPNLAIARWAQLGGVADARPERLPPARAALWRQALAGFSQEQVAAARQALEKAAARVAQDAAATGWLAGAAYSMADIAAYPHLAQFHALGIALPAGAQDWLARVAERPAVREAAGDMPIVATMGPEPGRWG
ncbi:glutathione S-transferase family protein [Altererythrobacter sp. CC-YST694]|uniref:glutathione S-transferase family protein n=1 Tax=Altererythrobacter sp. CC-YST694 TaxID=2755038 RepID=UPI001D018B96|nr:glutathione S-transferase family protein [Altererythrobacter sp. CC-YST694]MCB5425040.1 glutathione S-transferase family protein [Altererythrobacter sp. CC-YST694]